MTFFVIAVALSFLSLAVLAIATSQPPPEPVGRHRATVAIGV